MRHAVVILSMVACYACGSSGNQPTETIGTVAPTATLVDRVWMRSDSTGLPGVMRIFLSDGTLVIDSCWETYQLAAWRAESGSTLIWQEASAEIQATVVYLDATKLILRLSLASGIQEEHYRLAPVPYICPDMPR
ncbi:MAG TPA: hypothetical protein VED46_18735 [Alphaproteobacteria bacterium]|nr:hypothetical protein [Alphaproteobacteria bacterium]